MSLLDEELKSSDPARGLDDATVEPLVRAVWRDVQAERVARPRLRTWKVAIPLGVGVAILSTAAAVVTPTWVGLGEDAIIPPDVRIPISYTTSSGMEVGCSWQVYVGRDERTDADRRVAEALAATDWDGIGQEIYDYAVANPYAPGPDDDVNDSSQDTFDAISFKLAIVPVVEQRLPADLRGLTGLWRSTDSCTGPFR